MRHVYVGGLLLLVLVLGLGTPGQASNLTISVSDGGAPLTCADGAGCDSNGLSGAVTFTGVFGTMTVSLGGTGSGTPATNPLDMDLSYNLTANASAAGGTFTIQVSENELTASGATWNALVDGNQTNGATTAFSSFVDTSGTLFGTGTSLCGAGPSGASSIHLTCSAGPFTGAGFSLTEQITIVTQPGRSLVSGDAQLLATVPEPTTLLLLGSGLMVVALLGFAQSQRRRFI